MSKKSERVKKSQPPPLPKPPEIQVVVEGCFTTRRMSLSQWEEEQRRKGVLSK